MKKLLLSIIFSILLISFSFAQTKIDTTNNISTYVTWWNVVKSKTTKIWKWLWFTTMFKKSILWTTNLYTGFYTRNWSGYNWQCSWASTVKITNWLPSYFSWNTIYKLSQWTYTIGSWIFLTGWCTVITSDWTAILSWNTANSWSIYIWSGYNIIRNIEINWIDTAKEWISIESWVNNNTIYNVSIYKANRWVYIPSYSRFNVIESCRIYNSVIWIFLATQVNDTFINNTLSFNNSQNWIFINGWTRNVINNSAMFNNSIYWFVIQSGTGNVLSNSYMYNNASNWIRLVAGNFVNSYVHFNNNSTTIIASNTGYWTIYQDTSFAVWLKTWTKNDSLVSLVGRNTGNLVVTSTIISWYILPYDSNWTPLFNMALWTWAATRWAKWFTWRITKLEYTWYIYNQITPVKFNQWLTGLENFMTYWLYSRVWEAIQIFKDLTWRVRKSYDSIVNKVYLKLRSSKFYINIK